MEWPIEYHKNQPQQLFKARHLKFFNVEGPSTLSEFQPRDSVKRWLGTDGTKHVHGHKLKNNEMDEEQAAVAKQL